MLPLSILPSKVTLSSAGIAIDANVLQFPVANTNHGKTMSQIESEAISNAIQANKGNLTSAAKSLGLGRATLYRKVKEYSIDIRDSRIKKAA
jgi:transcriptional regulator of acetoin/glycerol metabolism